MRCADGKLRVVYVGSFRQYRTGIYLLDVNLQQTDSGFAVTYTMADSIQFTYTHFLSEPDPWIVKPVVCVDDAKTGHQYALVHWQDGWHRNHNTTVMYEVTNGKLIEKISTNGILRATIKTFDNQLDNAEAVVSYGQNGAIQYARITDLCRPFANMKPDLVGTETSLAFIEDQFGDGTRDLLAGNQFNGTITLVNFDLRLTSVNEDEAEHQTWARPVHGQLHLNLEHTCTISIDAVNSLGQKRTVVSGYGAQAGPSLLDIAPQLQALPPGAWFIRVSDGVRVVSLSYLR